MSNIVYLALGSNEGDRIAYLQQALTLLRADPNITVLSCSSFYETEPLGEENQRWYVNAAVAINTELVPSQLLERCQNIETQLGRVRDPNNQYAARTIDIDILMYGDLVVNDVTLVIPHPRMHERACVLVPLLEVNPRLKHPKLQKSVDQLHHDLDFPEMVFLYGTLPRELDTFYSQQSKED